MLQVKTRTDYSEIHGIGIFAVEPIAAGRLVWVFEPAWDRRIPLPEVDDTFLHHAYVNRAMPLLAVYCGDAAKFWNFHETPNCGEAEPPRRGFESPIVALRDIAPGEELTIEFRSDADAPRKMRIKTPCHTPPQ
jgi:SET domain-containing protein